MTELEKTVNDAYIIFAKTTAAEERQQKYDTLMQRAEQLQQQYGTEKFSVARKFEYVTGIAAIIKDEEIIETLQKEGYAVEKQGILKSLGSQPDAENL